MSPKIPEHAVKAIDVCSERGAIFVTSLDAYASVGDDDQALIETLKYAKQKNVEVHVVPQLVRPVAPDK